MRPLRSFFRDFEWAAELRFYLFRTDSEIRAADRRRRQDTIRHLRRTMINDLLNRHNIGDIVLFPEDLNRLNHLKGSPVLTEIEKIYRKYT